MSLQNTPGIDNLGLIRGETFLARNYVIGDADSIIDLTGASVWAEVRSNAKPTSTVLIDLEPELSTTTYDGSTVDCVTLPEKSHELTVEWPIGEWHWSLLIELSTGERIVPVRGTFTVEWNPTQPTT